MKVESINRKWDKKKEITLDTTFETTNTITTDSIIVTHWYYKGCNVYKYLEGEEVVGIWRVKNMIKK